MYKPKTEEQMNEFKKFVDKVIQKELDSYEYYDENGVGQREEHVKKFLDYDNLVYVAYRDFIKGYEETAEYHLLNELFYN